MCSPPSKMLADLEQKWGMTLLERAHVQSDTHFTAWEDFAITAMVERGLGVSILPGLILQRIPYKIEIRSCSSPITTQSALL